MSYTEAVEDRARSYYNVDGVGEFSIAVMCLGSALLAWQQVRTTADSFWNRPSTFYIYFAVLIALIHFGTKAVKSHLTYPRTGWVEYRRRDTVWMPMLRAFLFSFAAILVVVVFVKSHWDLSKPVSLVGLLLAGTYARGIARTVRWKWAVVWAMTAVAIAIPLLPEEVLGSMASHSWITERIPARLFGAVWLTLAAYGTMLLVSGGISLGLYLHRTELRAPEEQ